MCINIYIHFFLQGLYTEGGDMNHELSDMDLLNVDGPAAKLWDQICFLIIKQNPLRIKLKKFN